MSARNLAEHLEASAARWPERSAVIDPGGAIMTFAQLNQSADRLAAYLVDSGVASGDRVGVVLPKTSASVVSLFGIMKAGAVYVPVDASAPVERSKNILQDCGVRAVIVDARSIATIDECGLDLAAVIVVGEASCGAGLASRIAKFSRIMSSEQSGSRRRAVSDDLAYIIYTSGSTGTPKGAMIRHSSAVSYIDWASSLLQPTEHDRFSSHTPFHFDASVHDIYTAVKHGASLHLIAEDVAKAPRALAQFISDRKLTIWTSTPSALMLLLQFGRLETYGPTTLRTVCFGGEVFPVKALRDLKRLWPEPVFYNLYGPTETTTACTAFRIPDVVPGDRESPYPIGHPCSNCQAAVFDADGRAVPEGQTGFLHISGSAVFAGYWNRPEQTAAAMLVKGSVAWYNTGDLVTFDPADGYSFVGRKDGMIKRRGFRVELGEIERALYSHPRVLEAGIVVHTEGQAEARLAAFLFCDDGPVPSIVEMKQYCATKLPAYMVPDVFVFRGRLPRTSSDKIDLRALRDEFLVSAGS